MLGKGASNARGIATIAAKLVDLGTDPKYIWQIFDWSRFEGSVFTYTKWSFGQYVKELKSLKSGSSEADASEIDRVIQEGLGADLISRFACLKGHEDPLQPSFFELLKRELAKNCDLMEFNFPLGVKIKEEVKEYVEFICQRNLLYKYTDKEGRKGDYNLDKFIEYYNKVPADRCSEVLSHVGKLKVLAIVAQDLGSAYGLTNNKVDLQCKRLRELDPKHQITLLEHCFALEKSEEQSAHKKAVLVSKLLEQPALFDPAKQSDPLIQEISSQIYWAISPEGGFWGKREGQPYYSYDELKANLKNIESKTAKDNLGIKSILSNLLDIYESGSTKPEESVEKVLDDNVISQKKAVY